MTSAILSWTHLQGLHVILWRAVAPGPDSVAPQQTDLPPPHAVARGAHGCALHDDGGVRAANGSHGVRGDVVPPRPPLLVLLGAPERCLPLGRLWEPSLCCSPPGWAASRLAVPPALGHADTLWLHTVLCWGYSQVPHALDESNDVSCAGGMRRTVPPPPPPSSSSSCVASASSSWQVPSSLAVAGTSSGASHTKVGSHPPPSWQVPSSSAGAGRGSGASHAKVGSHPPRCCGSSSFQACLASEGLAAGRTVGQLQGPLLL